MRKKEMGGRTMGGGVRCWWTDRIGWMDGYRGGFWIWRGLLCTVKAFEPTLVWCGGVKAFRGWCVWCRDIGRDRVYIAIIIIIILSCALKNEFKVN